MTRITINLHKLPNGKVDVSSQIISDEGISAKEIAHFGLNGLLNAAVAAHNNQLCNCIKFAIKKSLDDFYSKPGLVQSGQHN